WCSLSSAVSGLAVRSWPRPARVDSGSAATSGTGWYGCGWGCWRCPSPPATPDSTLTVATALGNAAFLQHAWVPALGTDTPLWSLAYEFWYYALFPCLVLTVRRSTPARLRVAS